MRTLVLCLPFVAGALAADTPGGYGATVAADSAPVYSEPSSSSTLLKKVQQGEALTIDYSVETGEGEWCSLSGGARGYVLCGFLKREEPPKQEAGPAPLPTVLTVPAGHAPLPSRAASPAASQVANQVHQAAADPVMSTPEQTALMSAAKMGSVAAVQLALEKGAIVNGPDKDGKTALMWAAYMGRNEAIAELLAAGADASAADSLGWTALEAAVWARHPAALPLLLEQGVDVNARDSEGRTPLMHAAQYGDLTMIHGLLEKGADPNARNRFEQTPLMFAVALADPDAAELLLSAGADVDARDAAGRSVLINAALAAGESTANVQLLLRARADINAKDNDGRTALAWALKKGHAASAQVLKKAGAVEW